MRFNADELLGIAEQVERNGAAFYTAAAERVAEGPTRDFLRELAAWELQHEKTFTAMRRALTPEEREPTTYDPYDEIALYLQAVADGHVFPLHENLAAVLGEHPTPVHILELAQGREQDSIVYYTAMREAVPARLGREAVTAIIKEEVGHLARLHAERTRLRA
jgi:rubrerythrin